tara:strand:- start:423 stop:638 length:216 start_codon:yes stop_codon:yes gene_type:complete
MLRLELNLTERKKMQAQKQIQDMYQGDHIKAFENAKSKGMTDPGGWMYMYSQGDKDFFKNINFRNYISFKQ